VGWPSDVAVGSGWTSSVFVIVGGSCVAVRVSVGGWVGVRVRVAVGMRLAVDDAVNVEVGVSVSVSVGVEVGVSVDVPVADGEGVVDVVGEGNAVRPTVTVAGGWNGDGVGPGSKAVGSRVIGGSTRPVYDSSSWTVRSSCDTLPMPIASAASTSPKNVAAKTTGINARPRTIVPHGRPLRRRVMLYCRGWEG
jgi:hypothetical protein